jgi:hypothetical protein
MDIINYTYTLYMYKEYDVNGYTFWLQILNKGFDSSIFLKVYVYIT